MTKNTEQPTPLQIAIRSAIEQSGRSRDHFDRLIQQKTGKKGKVLFDIDRGKSKNPSMETLKLIAEVFGKPVAYFTPRNETQTLPAMAAPPRVSDGDDEMVDIATLDLSFSMGAGTNVDDYIEEATVRFALDFVRSFTRTAPDRLRRARGVGDSMWPTIHNSDAVWIDTTQRMLNLHDRVWAISLFGSAAIKRLRPIGKGKILIMSDNPDIPNQEVDEEDLLIGGRVIRLERDI